MAAQCVPQSLCFLVLLLSFGPCSREAQGAKSNHLLRSPRALLEDPLSGLQIHLPWEPGQEPGEDFRGPPPQANPGAHRICINTSKGQILDPPNSPQKRASEITGVRAFRLPYMGGGIREVWQLPGVT